MYSEKRNELLISLVQMPLLMILLFAAITLIPGCSKIDASTNPVSNTSGNDISISGMAFQPSSTTISAGMTIKWTNNNGVTLTVTSGAPGNPTGLFDSGNLAPGGTFSYTFDQEGMYSYYCKIHSSVRATITVQSSSGTGEDYGGAGY